MSQSAVPLTSDITPDKQVFEGIESSRVCRWLTVGEIVTILTHAESKRYLVISTSPPKSPPSSGTLILYDRTVTRHYKHDGYAWIKKRNSNKIREDHVKLRYGGEYRVAGSYVHCATLASMHRRAYTLLNEESDDNKKGEQQEGEANLVLVHYLDIVEAASSMTQMQRQQEQEQAIGCIPHQDTKTSEISANELTLSPRTYTIHHQLSSYDDNTCLGAFWNNIMLAENESQATLVSASHFTLPPPFSRAPTQMSLYHPPPFVRKNSLESWSEVVSKHGSNDHGQQQLHVSNDHLQYSSRFAANEVLPARKQIGYAMTSRYDPAPKTASKKDPADSQASNESAVEKGRSGVPAQEVSSSKEDQERQQRQTFDSEDYSLPEIVDLTPSSAPPRVSPIKIAISVSSPFATRTKNGSDAKKWSLFVAFIKNERGTPSQHNQSLSIHLAPIKELTPYSFKCDDIPQEIMKRPGKWHTVLLRAQLSDDYGMAALNAEAATKLMQGRLNENGERERSPTSSSIPKVNDLIEFLTQLPGTVVFEITERDGKSGCPHDAAFPCNSYPTCSASERWNPEATGTPGDARNPAVAALSAVAQTLMDINKPETESIEIGGIIESCSESKKRPCSQTIDLVLLHDFLTATDDSTKHRKFCVVETHTDSTGVSPIEPRVKGAQCVNHDAKAPAEQKGNGTNLHLLNDSNFNIIDDDAIVTRLDNLLIRVVDSLVAWNLDEFALRVKSGSTRRESNFTVLHYAALYKQPELLSRLLVCGMNPNAPALSSRLTPLHLACSGGDFSAAKALVEHGCDIQSLDSDGLTPHEYAISQGFPEIATWLREKIPFNPSYHGSPEKEGEVDGNRLPSACNSGFRTDLDMRLVRLAFSTFSLTEKFVFHYLAMEELRKKSRREEEHLKTPAQINEMSVELLTRSKKSFDLRRAISESDRAGLDTAINLLNEEEREDLGEKCCHQSCLKEWILHRNFEVMLEILKDKGHGSGQPRSGGDATKDNFPCHPSINRGKLSRLLASLVIQKTILS